MCKSYQNNDIKVIDILGTDVWIDKLVFVIVLNTVNQV